MAQKGPSGPVYVEYTQISLADKEDKINAVGILLPAASVVIKPELSGKIVAIYFNEGQAVKKGDILIKIDDTTFQADVKDAQAKVFLAEQNLKRLIAVKGSSTEQQLDISKAALLQAQATLEIATSQLAKSTIKAPFDGLVSLSNTEVGEYIQAGTALLSLVNQQKLKLEFTIPERISHLAKKSQIIQFQSDNFPDAHFEGIVYAISPEIDQQGRSLTIRAWVDNQSNQLIPGLFVRLTLNIPQDKKVMQLPEESMFAQNGKQWVYAVNNQAQKQVAKLTEIKIIARQLGLIEFEGDLKPNDIIVKSGQQKLRDGAEISDITTLNLKNDTEKNILKNTQNNNTKNNKE